MKKYGRVILIALAVILLIWQFIRPEKNLSDVRTHDISTAYVVPEDVQSILKVACNDCHTNKTDYPWYAEVQPVAMWINNHVNDGKRHLNFSEFTSRPIAIQNHKFEEIVEQIKEGEMPLTSYTLIHRDAVLSQEQKNQLIGWAEAMMDTLKAKYPADSLVMPRRR